MRSEVDSAQDRDAAALPEVPLSLLEQAKARAEEVGAFDASVRARFFAKVRQEGECLVWTAATSEGYGVLTVNRKKWYAHRLAQVFSGSVLVAGMETDHLCRNRACLRTNHLEQVTPRTNNLRGETFGAIYAKRVTCARGHTLFPDRTRVRRCKECHNERAHAYYHANSARILEKERAKRLRKSAA